MSEFLDTSNAPLVIKNILKELGGNLSDVYGMYDVYEAIIEIALAAMFNNMVCKKLWNFRGIEYVGIVDDDPIWAFLKDWVEPKRMFRALTIFNKQDFFAILWERTFDIFDGLSKLPYSFLRYLLIMEEEIEI